jgi:ABC-type nitrate/sulfonate/bicarbonate transport system permease component
MGHFDPFPPPRLNGRYPFGLPTPPERGGALLLWEALCRGFGVRPILLPPPSAILAAMVTRGDLLFANLWPSVYQTVLAFLLSVVGGVLLGILITYSVTVRKGFYPLIAVSQVVPKISIAPLFIVWFGTGLRKVWHR